jgi:hypothetical protein
LKVTEFCDVKYCGLVGGYSTNVSPKVSCFLLNYTPLHVRMYKSMLFPFTQKYSKLNCCRGQDVYY